MKIENEVCVMEFVQKGGEMLSMTDKETGVQFLYQGDTSYWGGKNPTLFPIVGNTFDGTYVAKGKTYTFKNHGLIRYATLECIAHKQDSITFELKENEETLKAYPYAFTYHITYTLKGKKVLIDYDITNNDTEAMPFTFGLHPGFKAPLLKDETYEDFTIAFEQEEHAQQLVFHNVEKPYEKEVVFKSIPLNYEQLKQYQTLVFKNIQSDYVVLQGKGKQGIKIKISGYPFLAIWSPINAPFVCIEPWYSHADYEPIDGAFKNREGMMELAPNETFTTSYSIEIVG